jgi:hypothetical protein
MKLRFPVLTFALAVMTLAVTTSVAHAQTGLYLNPIITRVSNSTPDSGTFAFLGQNSTSAIFGGVDIGGYYMFGHYNGFDIGVDIRDAIQHGNTAGLNSFMVGPRIAFKPVKYGVKPYLQVAVGAGRTHSAESPAHISRLEYAVSGGLDKPLGRFVDFRAIEIGYGSVTTMSSAIYGGTTPIPASRMLNFSTGFVFKIP